MAARKPIVFGNWKLHHTIAEALALVTELKNQLAVVRDVEVGVAPVFTSIPAVAKRLEGTSIRIAAQDCFWEDRGPWTGEVSAPLLRDAGCHYAIVGHSERRQHFGDTDVGVGRKAAAALAGGLNVILCVGETEAQRDAGQTFDRVQAQLEAGLAGIAADQMARVVVAYEPVWAIGTGRTATPEEAQEVHAHIRSAVERRYGADVARGLRIQYGGSVKPENAADLIRQPDIDGALVGGASLTAEPFVAIVKAAAAAAR
ncbi:MAG: triose-phosphate isomerase [Deltaproteobacteria bacterium]|nr:MAG: triose-phosphate isomerase [Deltaproteobacteria bacterium]